MYGAFINKVAVCQGYTLAYKFLLNKLGVQSYACASNGLNHVWNIVYLNGEKYHVDLTWDDILPDTYGQSLHENFLVSTDKLIQNGHYFVEEVGYAYIDYDNSPTSTTYDDYFWQDVNTAFVLLNGEIYYTDRELIIGNNGATQYILIKSYSDNRILFKKEDYWFSNLNESFYNENYARLTTDGTNLLFSLSDSIYSLNPETLEAKTLVTKPASFNKTFSIYGFKYSNSTLYYQISNSPAFKNLFTYTATYYSPTQLKAGNINLDEEGVVDLIDVTTLARALAGWKVECNENGFDVNGDGNANLFDLVHLAQYVAGWKSVVIH